MLKRIGFVWVVMVLAIATSAVHAAAPFADRIPDDALIYAGWRGVEALVPQYDKSNLKGLVENSKLRAYLVENLPKWIASVVVGDPDKVKQMQEMLDGAELLWRHPMAFYMGPIAMDMQQGMPKIKLACLCDAGADAPAVKDFAQKLVDLIDLPGGLKPIFNPTVAVDGTTVIFTMGSVDAATFSAPAAPLAKSAAFTAALKGMRDDAAFVFFYDVRQYIDCIFNIVGPDNAAEIERPLNVFGISSLTQFAFTAGFDGPQWREQTFIGIDGPRHGMLTVLDAPAITTDALHLVPQAAVAVSVHHIDMAKLWAAAREIYGIDPASVLKFDGPVADASKMLGFDIEKDLIAALGNEWIVYSAPVAEDGTYPTVLVQKVKDPAAIAKVLAGIEKQINVLGAGKVKAEKIDNGKFEVTGVRLPQVTVAWALRGDYLYVSTPEGILMAADHVETKGGGGESITANPGFAKVLADLPGDKPSSLCYSEPAKLYPQVYRLANDLLPLARLAGANIPGDLLPLPKKAAPFLAPGWSSAWSDATGYHVVKCTAFPQADLLAGQICGPTPIPVEILILSAPAILRAQAHAMVESPKDAPGN
ncbi:MAG: hypothetical protein FWD61_10400 [Phycisphaerales bacterium]|nr:hypothetical protein [Phycisphaerales bacterium]